MAPLPPRPKNISTQELDDAMPEKTLQEQQGGRDNVRIAEAKLMGEMEEGRKLVALNQRRAERKLTKDSERGAI